MICKYVEAVIFGIKYNNAINLYAKGCLDEAFEKIKALEKGSIIFWKKYRKGKKSLYKVRMTKGSILLDMCKYAESVSVFSKVIDAITNNKRFYGDEKEYLLYFSKTSIYSAVRYGLKKDMEKPVLGSIDLVNVNKTTMRYFPVRDHPDWYKYFPDDKKTKGT